MEGDSNPRKPTINNEELQEKLLLHDHLDHKGGVKTMPFIIVNEAFERVASFGLMPNMIFYLTKVYHMEAVTGTSILSIWSALSDGLSIFGAFIADSYLGRFRVIALGSLSALVGMTLLWLTSMFPQLRPSSCYEFDTGTCNSTPTPTQLAFLFSSFGLISIGAGCIRPCSIAFGADQLKNNQTPDNQRLIESYFNWYYASVTISLAVAVTVLVYIQDQLGWQIGFAVPVLLMFCSALLFLLGSSLYIKVKVSESPFSGFFQVLIAAYKNRKMSLRPDDCYNHSNGVDRVELTESLRFLNKACVVRNLNMDPQSLPTVEKVESVKPLIRILPVWSSSIMLSISIQQAFPTLQAETMNRHVTSGFEIPAASFTLFTILTVTLWIIFYSRVLVPLLAKHTRQTGGLHPKTRIGIGLLIVVVAMLVSAIVETIRRDMATRAENSKTVAMSALWLVPQFALLGLAEAFNAVGQIEFFYSELPNTMSSLAMAMTSISLAISGLLASLLVNLVDSITSQGSNVSWLSSDINEGHVDYYYWLLCFLNLLNFFYFKFCCRVHESMLSPPETSRLSHELGEGCDHKHQASTSGFTSNVVTQCASCA